MLEEQLPAAPARHQHVAVPVDAHEVGQPAAAARVQRGDEPALAQGTTPYAAFSTLQPVTTRPSSTRAAAPTGEPVAARRHAPSRRPPRSAVQSNSESSTALTGLAPSVPLSVRGGHPELLGGQREHEQGHDVRRHLGEVTGDGQVAGTRSGPGHRPRPPAPPPDEHHGRAATRRSRGGPRTGPAAARADSPPLRWPRASV